MYIHWDISFWVTDILCFQECVLWLLVHCRRNCLQKWTTETLWRDIGFWVTDILCFQECVLWLLVHCRRNCLQKWTIETLWRLPAVMHWHKKTEWKRIIMYRNNLQDSASASMALSRLQVCSNCVSCQEMHESIIWIIKEYFDSAGFWEG